MKSMMSHMSRSQDAVTRILEFVPVDADVDEAEDVAEDVAEEDGPQTSIVAPCGTLSSSTRMASRMAMTPSLNASSRFLPILRFVLS
jgi:2-phospho-L-lactate guanylyltransferase (CobY/MobA/RfbA family)